MSESQENLKAFAEEVQREAPTMAQASDAISAGVAPKTPAPTTELAKAPEKTVVHGPEAFFIKALGARQSALKNFLGTEENALKFMSAVMHAIQKTPELLNCDSESVLGAFMECAALDLYPSTHSGDCYVLPYKGKAQFQLGYKGVRTLAYRAGILRCGAEIVYKNDKFKKTLGTVQELVHEPAEGERGEAVGAYAWAEVTRGSIIFEHMTKDEIMAIKDTSPAKGSQYSPWNKNDPMLWMWKKTAFKQLGKMMPSSDKLARALHLDNVSERGGYIKSEHELVEMDFETQDNRIKRGKDKKEELRKRKPRKKASKSL